MRHYSRLQPMSTKLKSPTRRARLLLLPPLLLLLLLLLTPLLPLPLPPLLPALPRFLSHPFSPAPLPSRTRCVLALGFQNDEGIGQALKRNQFAIFVAQLLRAKLSLPDRPTSHNYSLAHFFDACPAPAAPRLARCTLRLDELLLERCARRDCACLRDSLLPYLRPLAAACPLVAVHHDKFKTQEYSGCIADPLTRYLGGPNRWPAPYNAVHFRQGDLADRRHANSTYMRQLYNQINFMCKHSPHDIIVVTEGEPELPTCGNNRVVLAGNTSVREAFSIMQHARWIGVGKSGFAIAMMQIARPQRVLMEHWVMPNYDWLDVPKWTVFNSVGAAFNFRSAEDAFYRVYASAGIDLLTYKNPALLKYVRFDVQVPSRRWETEALPP